MCIWVYVCRHVDQTPCLPAYSAVFPHMIRHAVILPTPELRPTTQKRLEHDAHDVAKDKSLAILHTLCVHKGGVRKTSSVWTHRLCPSSSALAAHRNHERYTAQGVGLRSRSQRIGAMGMLRYFCRTPPSPVQPSTVLGGPPK